jgi:hypothetical protein
MVFVEPTQPPPQALASEGKGGLVISRGFLAVVAVLLFGAFAASTIGLMMLRNGEQAAWAKERETLTATVSITLPGETSFEPTDRRVDTKDWIVYENRNDFEPGSVIGMEDWLDKPAGKRQRLNGEDAQGEKDAKDGPQRSARRCPENIGRYQRITKQALEGGARDRERGATQDGRQHTRPPDVENDSLASGRES